MLNKNSKPTPLPCLEPLRCFLSFKRHNRRLTCKPGGKIRSSKNHKSWEEWKTIQVTHDNPSVVFVQSVEHGGKFLKSTPDGKVGSARHVGSQEKWRILVSKNGTHQTLVSVVHGSALACDSSGALYMTDEVDSPLCALDLKPASGELCFLSSKVHDKRIRCHPFGNVDTCKNWEGWEVWRLVRDNEDSNHIYITSWTHRGRFLASSNDGKVFTTENRGCWEKWIVQKKSEAAGGDGGVEITSVVHGKHLACNSEGHLYTSDTPQSHLWHLEPGHGSLYYISSAKKDKRIGSNPTMNGDLFTTTNRQEWEQWKIENQGGGWVTLFSKASGKYLGADPELSTLVLSGVVSAKELWSIGQSHSGLYFASSIEHNLQLFFDGSSGRVRLMRDTDEDTSGTFSKFWNLEPIMPKTVSGSQLIGIGTIAGISLVTAIAAPFAVMGIVGAMGFGAGGIGAGSMAAGMMSAEAIASGGAVAAGGTVATLQSIGAAGLGIAGTSASVGAGAVLGGTVTGLAVGGAGSAGTGQVSSAGGGDHEKIASQESLPFCAWRSWSG